MGPKQFKIASFIFVCIFLFISRSNAQDVNNESLPKDRRSGFTLIEIMAVVIIMGLLMGIVGVTVFSRVDDARVATARIQMKQLENALTRPIHWMGKPYSSFSLVVKKFLQDMQGIKLDEQVIFFDDNIENVIQLTSDLLITGACVLTTGLSRDLNTDTLRSQYQTLPDYSVNTFSLEPRV